MKNRKILSLFAYVSVVLIAISLLLGFLSSEKVFNWGTQIEIWCDRIAFYLSLVVTMACSFMYARSRRNNIYTIVLAIAVIVIVVFLII